MLRLARLSVLSTALLVLAFRAPGLAAEPACPPSVSVPTQAELQEAVRNARDHGALWRIDELHGDDRLPFAAIGILHMVGDAALQKLLAERGFKLERVSLGSR